MTKKIGELTVQKSSYYDDKIEKALKESGLILVLFNETIDERCYIVAREYDENKEGKNT